jgi:putative transcriptional regulator
MKRASTTPVAKKPTIAEDVISGLQELLDVLDSGNDLAGKFNCYQMQLDLKPMEYTPEMVKETRQLLGASQAIFASFLGVSTKTVSQWEQGLGDPKPIACRFMDEIRRNPTYYTTRLRESVVPKPRGKPSKQA